jgi:hypothetical protein
VVLGRLYSKFLAASHSDEETSLFVCYTTYAIVLQRKRLTMMVRKKRTGRVRLAQRDELARRRPDTNRRLEDALTIAEQSGLLRGARTEVVRGRMPKALVEKAMATAGVHSNTELIEVALANLAVADHYADWLLAQRGSVSKQIDLEF